MNQLYFTFAQWKIPVSYKTCRYWEYLENILENISSGGEFDQ